MASDAKKSKAFAAARGELGRGNRRGYDAFPGQESRPRARTEERIPMQRKIAFTRLSDGTTEDYR